MVPLLLLASACKDDGGSAYGGFPGAGGDAKAPAAAGTDGSSGDGGGATAAPRQPTSAGVPDNGGGNSATDASVLNGVWEGHYVCHQGPRKMRLHLSGLNEQVTGTFDFGDGDPSSSGSYMVSGTLSGGQVTLHAGQWIKQPDGYVTIDLVVTTITPGAISGSVDGPDCTTFEATKTSGD
ncbi:hypothetical protein [Labedaea rhizosphaerae]|uniref:Uncharacterized protein n=1 Tax=Labedaea rhizosphaerae TaxID=598644 RepID=A0A4R6SN28_LABRH|nr:hypothetical protein [Labedaea rhizosphaerae]TDQ05926.1 hypothetical protein EV186_1011904 [Labedaea rhizosphaerae]